MKAIENIYDAFFMEEPVTIKCIVNGKKLMGKIMSFSDHDPIQTGFNLEFSDGTAFWTIVCEDEDDVFSIQNEKFQPYVNAIKNSLSDFYSVCLYEWYKFEITYNNRYILIWVGADNEEKGKFLVRFEGDYQFNLYAGNGNWQAISHRVFNPNPINPEIVDLIVEELKKRVA